MPKSKIVAPNSSDKRILKIISKRGAEFISAPLFVCIAKFSKKSDTIAV
jgi:hypothetical protein